MPKAESAKPIFNTGQLSLEDFIEVIAPGKTSCHIASLKTVKRTIDGAQEIFVMKTISKKTLLEYANFDVMKSELKLRKKLAHPHINRMLHMFEDKNNVYIVSDYEKLGPLSGYLKKKKKLQEKEAFVYFFQTCIGLDYLHKKKILHRDLNPENLLLNKDGNIVICGFKGNLDDLKKSGTYYYMAPEIQNQAQDSKSEIWSLGTLLYEMLFGFVSLQNQQVTDEKSINNLIEGLQCDSAVSKEAQDLIKSLWKSDPQERPTLDQIFIHPWLQIYEKHFKIQISEYVYDPSKYKKSEEEVKSTDSPSKKVEKVVKIKQSETQPLLEKIAKLEAENEFLRNQYDCLIDNVKSKEQRWQEDVAKLKAEIVLLQEQVRES
jgi:serine/threonine protein kinase